MINNSGAVSTWWHSLSEEDKERAIFNAEQNIAMGYSPIKIKEQLTDDEQTNLVIELTR